MTREEMLQHLQRWERVVLEVQAVDDELDSLTGRAPEGRLTTAMWAAIGAYSETLETLLIGSSASNWLEWYWIANDMGAKGHIAAIGPKAEDRTIDSLEALADLLMECRA